MLYPNLDFEYELAEAARAGLEGDEALLSWGRTYRPNRHLEKIIATWADILRLLPVQDFSAWGMSPSAFARRLDLGLGLLPFGPALVGHINDKRFSHDLEVDLGTAFPHARLVSSVAELDEAIAECPYPWVAKHPFGVSGRERIKGHAAELTEDQRRWAQRQFDASWELVFEPWAEVEREFSLQYELLDGRAQLVGVLELITDSQGTHRGHRSLPEGSGHEVLLPPATRAAERIAALGYVGPVGVDAFIARLDDKVVHRPITEINARVTFGRLALELGKFLPTGHLWEWWHPSKNLARDIDFPRLKPLDEGFEGPGEYRLPEFADPGGRSKTLLRTLETHPHQAPA